MKCTHPTLLFGIFFFIIISCSVAEFPLKTSTWTKTELFFGLSIQNDLGNGTISTSVISYDEFEQFVEEYVTPVFPDGLTYLNSSGQWLSSSGVLVTEPSIYMIVYYEDSSVNEESIQQIVQNYMEIYNQEAVLYSFIAAIVCTTPNYCLSSENTYHSPYTLVAFLLSIFNSVLFIILFIIVGIFFYRKKGKENHSLLT